MRIQVYKDPVTKVLFGRFGYKLVLIWFIFPLLLILTSAYYETLTTIELPVGPGDVETLPLFKDETFYSLLIVVPCVLILLNYFLESIPGILVNLWENKVIQSKIKPELLIEQYNMQLKTLEKKINSKKAFTLISVGIPIIVFLSLYGYYKTLTINYPVVTSYDIRFFPLSGVVFYVIAIFLTFLVIPVLYKGVSLVFLPRKLHKEFHIRAKPLHPDNCGGLKSLGDLCIRFDYVFLVGAVGSALQLAFSQGTEVEIYLYFFLVYGFFVTFFFFYPLWPVHNVMKAQKYDLLNKLNEKLDPAYQEITESADITAENLENIERIDRIYDRVSKMPVWPFDTGGLIRYLTTVFIPFLGIVADMFIF